MTIKDNKIKGGEAARSMRGAETRTASLYEAQRDSLTIYKKATRNHVRNLRKGITGEEFLNVTNNTVKASC